MAKLDASIVVSLNGVVDIDSLIPNPWNTNHVSPDNEAKIEASLKRLGWAKPIIVRSLADGTLEILGGEHRWRAAKRLGYKQVPIFNLGTVDDAKAKEIGLVDNARYGDDDALELSELMKTMGTPDELAVFLPYTDADLNAIFSASTLALDSLEPEADTNTGPDLPTERAVQTHQFMRFKVPIEDAQKVEQAIEAIMKVQGFTQEDSLANAGNALVHLCKESFGV